MELGLDGGVAEGADDGGGEVGVCCEGWLDEVVDCSYE